MVDPSSKSTDVLTVLDTALRLLARDLDAIEEWRALRQLDERERDGRPIAAMDGIALRGRLVGRLDATSPAWRAYVQIEQAIGVLRAQQPDERPSSGPLMQVVSDAKRAEPASAAASARLATIDPVAIATKAAITTETASAPTPDLADTAERIAAAAQDLRHRRPASDMAMSDAAERVPAPVTSEVATAVAASGEGSATSAQRMRVKVRAASIAIPMLVAATRERATGRSPAADAEATASPAQRPDRPAADESPVPAQQVLERIRPVQAIAASRAAGPEATPVVDTAIWGARATAAPEPELGGLGGVPHSIHHETSGAGPTPGPVEALVGSVSIAAPVVAKADEQGRESDVALPASVRRLTAVEAEVEALGDAELVRWTQPLEVVERARPSGEGRASEAFEPDDEQALLGLAGDEADVVIVLKPERSATGITPAEGPTSHGAGGPPAALVPAAAATPAAAVPSPVPGSANDATAIDDQDEPEGPAALAMDVEEASVEIIVRPSPAARARA